MEPVNRIQGAEAGKPIEIEQESLKTPKTAPASEKGTGFQY